MSDHIIKKIAVLGSGVMGAQIAALLSAKFSVILYDVAATHDHPNQTVLDNFMRSQQLKPAAFYKNTDSHAVTLANYQTDLALLNSVDLIIEAVAEVFSIKKDLYQKIVPHLNENAIIATNTSGISINALAETLPHTLRHRFCGVHFFNPPRYLPLVELIPQQHTDPTILDHLETWLVSVWGKQVIRAMDTPNFIANRVGIFALLITAQHAEKFKINFALADALTGVLIGRSKSATFRTFDVIGLDTMSHVIKTFQETLSDDPWHAHYVVPQWMNRLIAQKSLGQKTGIGIYKKGESLQVFDLMTEQYQVPDITIDSHVLSLLKEKDWAKKLKALQQCAHPQAQFIWACFRDLFHYIGVHAQAIAHHVRDIDAALRFGFAWQEGPFAIWQAADWQWVVRAIDEAVKTGETLVNIALPSWASDALRAGVYTDAGAYNPVQNVYVPRSPLPVYARQYFPNAFPREQFNEGKTISENEAIRVWHTGDDIAILNFKTKMNTASHAVLESIVEAVAFVETRFKGLVLWQRTGSVFCVGADLRQFVQFVTNKQLSLLDAMIDQFQQASLALRYSSIPTVAAVKGMALGGGCELMLHCTRVVAHVDAMIGLVETGVGLLPAGGGCKEFLHRAQQAPSMEVSALLLKQYFMQIAKGFRSAHARQAQDNGFLNTACPIIFHPDELLHVAKSEVCALAEQGYTAPVPLQLVAPGQIMREQLQQLIDAEQAAARWSAHDAYLAEKIADIFCGGHVTAGTLLPEQHYLKLERELFVECAQQEKSLARIQHLLENGKPLRN